MNLHEYQGKQLFAQYGLPVSKGVVAETPQEAVAAMAQINGDKWVVKAQVHAGGRGKAGGVKLVSSKGEVEEFAKHWLGRNLVTYQTDVEIEKVAEETPEKILKAIVDPLTGAQPYQGRDLAFKLGLTSLSRCKNCYR